jgi:CHRD domain
MVRTEKSVVQIVGVSMLILASALLVSQTKVYGQEPSPLGKFTAELQPRTGSNATGNAVLQILPDLNTISYIIDASGINNVTDISMSLDMGTGRYPDVVSIRTATAEGIMPGPVNGPLAEGNFTASDLTGALSGARLADFVKDITDGKIVVRVSSSNFPLGELVGKVNVGSGNATGNMSAPAANQTATGNMSAPAANQTATGNMSAPAANQTAT